MRWDARESVMAVDDVARVAADEHDAGRLDGHIGAGADGDADIRRSERGGVVDAVADHRHPPTTGLEAAHRGRLVCREHLGRNLVDAQPAGDRVRDGRASPVIIATRRPGRGGR